MKSILTAGVLLLVSFESTCIGKDYFLTIGGGYSPTGNQVSLEKNVFFFRGLLNELYGEEPSHQVLFADGKDPGRDLQFYDPNSPLPRANELLAKIHRQTKNLTYAYRNHQIDDVYGASSRENIQNWFEKVGAGLTADDRLFIYATAHGGRGADKDEPTNTKLYLWNNQSLTMREMAAFLDQIDPEVPVVMVMVQCYSGGFADLIFEDGDSSKGATSYNRCGFFATVHDRVAAGCTADIREEDYHEYSTYFLSALGGKTRNGSPIDVPDFDEDGRISYEEAHAFALINSTTIDISIKTSDAFLREFSSTKDDEIEGLLTSDSALEDLLARATPCERAVVEALQAELELEVEGDELASAAKDLARRLMSDKRNVSRDKRRIAGNLSRRADSIKKALQRRWPEISNIWNPEVHRLLSEEGDAIVAFIEGHRDFSEFSSLEAQSKEISVKESSFDRKWVKCQRLIRTLENVALAANLELVADDQVQQRFAELCAAERQFLGQ